ncbi:MAG: prepilin peptidase [Sandaracinaceae bacterium]|nr:prepilin peptidase [Sandaracinaceae bacterium]
MNPALVASILALAITGTAAVTDYKTGLIPNWLTLPPLALAPIAWAFVIWPSGILYSLFGAFCCGLPLYILFRIDPDGCGGGDVKLFGAVGAMLLFEAGLESLFFSLCATAVWALAKLAWQGKIWRTLKNSGLLFLNMFLPKSRKHEIKPGEKTTIRLGGFAFFGTLIAVVLRQPQLMVWI